jgi:hypothetical protein
MLWQRVFAKSVRGVSLEECVMVSGAGQQVLLLFKEGSGAVGGR